MQTRMEPSPNICCLLYESVPKSATFLNGRAHLCSTTWRAHLIEGLRVYPSMVA